MAPAKAKGQKMSMVEFLGVDKPSGDFSWADESEEAGMEQPNVPAERRERPSYGMGFGSGGFDREARGGGFESRGYETRGGYAVREPLDLPTEPPFTAHIGNLSFEATAADVTDLFADCGVTNVRIVEDRQTNTPKGFGYIEFETVAGLQKALDLSGTTLMGRTIRTSVADPPKETRADPREMDWTRRGPLPPAPSERRVPDRSNFGRNMDAASDAGSDRGGRRSNFESDGKFRDFGNWERKGPLSPPAGAGFREGGRPRNNDGAAPAWGEGRSQDGSRPPRPDRPERTPTAADMDNQWRTKMRPDAAPKEPTSPVAPAARPRLNLQKRTVSEAVSTPAAGAADSKASPFGAARPIDTATREREVEERRQLAIRQKKESDDKAKAEKAEKAEKQKKEPKVGTDSNKDAVEPPKGGGNFEILRRAGEDETNPSADKETEETAAPAAAAAADETPKEAATNGSWRTAEAPAEAPADDNDGWSTVDTTKKRGRRGGRF